MDITAYPKKLLIIGNGFDLQLGMHSSFKAFGAYRRKLLLNGPISSWTLIDMLLEHRTNGRWGEEDGVTANWDWWNFERFLRDSIINAIYNDDFLRMVTPTVGKVVKQKRVDFEKRAIGLVATLSRDGYLTKQVTDKQPVFYVINREKLSNITSQNIQNVPDGYFWQLLMLSKIDTYYRKHSFEYRTNVYFSENVTEQDTEEITSTNVTSFELENNVAALFPAFSMIKPLLIKELKIWESSFARFIADQQQVATVGGLNYKESSKRLIDSVLSVDHKQQYVQVLNFNYSLPTIEKTKYLHYYPLTPSLNIHGSIEDAEVSDSNISGIIIGYDYQILLDLPELVDDMAPFTKTFRISELNTALAKSPNNSRNMHLNYEVDKISIIGHSLSSADDSYFRTIFDAADLYDGTVILEYRYTNYPGRDQSISIETESLQKINALLIRYVTASRQENKDNLLHKLLLENRLILREYKTNEIMKL
ncbi:AbiH family protein [Lacticaseibacillus zhaodongensis]|uniref:AbiH family protein n=1 Tax=Lacticaseibacillus zhaodongensis TaxID=2668065 RepID=UPI0012D2F1AF|nr:AbiH family protein [Lacticaseibacillus zhaodongensis]